MKIICSDVATNKTRNTAHNIFFVDRVDGPCLSVECIPESKSYNHQFKYSPLFNQAVYNKIIRKILHVYEQSTYLFKYNTTDGK